MFQCEIINVAVMVFATWSFGSAVLFYYWLKDAERRNQLLAETGRRAIELLTQYSDELKAREDSK
jgi:hypothetical protein